MRRRTRACISGKNASMISRSRPSDSFLLLCRNRARKLTAQPQLTDPATEPLRWRRHRRTDQTVTSGGSTRHARLVMPAAEDKFFSLLKIMIDRRSQPGTWRGLVGLSHRGGSKHQRNFGLFPCLVTCIHREKNQSFVPVKDFLALSSHALVSLPLTLSLRAFVFVRTGRPSSPSHSFSADIVPTSISHVFRAELPSSVRVRLHSGKRTLLSVCSVLNVRTHTPKGYARTVARRTEK